MRTTILTLFLLLGSCVSKESNKVKAHKMYLEIKKDFNNVPEFKLSEVERLKSNIQFVDVRAIDERKVSIIPEAISKEEFEKNISTFKDKKIVVYCTIGYRSGKYVQKLKNMNIDAYNLEGSLLGWAHYGKPLVTPSGNEVKKAHVYGRSWNYLPEDFTSTW